MTQLIKTNFHIKRILLAVSVLAFLMSGTSCSLLKKRYEKTETEEHAISIENKTKISVDNINGDIRIFQNTSDSLLHMKIEKITQVQEKDLGRPMQNLRVKIDTAGSVISINSEYTKKKKFFNISFDDDEINYDLYVPNNIRIVIDNTNGDLFMTDVSNDIVANLTNSDVKLEKVFGKTKIDLVNGKVKGDLDSTRGLNIEITNGKAILSLGESFSAKFKLDVTNGKIKKDTLDFLDVTERKDFFEGRLGESESEVIIDITNGKISLSKR
jgi:hypothetical protein